MKKTVTVKDLCCERCARRLSESLMLEERILKAKANYKKGLIFVETTLTDEELTSLVTEKGYEVVSVALRKGIFG
jgi:copper chaperone CopZ